MAEQTLVIDRLVDGAGYDGPAQLTITDGRITGRYERETAGGDLAGSDPEHRQLGTVVPGFSDNHCHGARGVDFAQPGVDPQPAIDFHHQVGSTQLTASLATGQIADLRTRLSELAPVVHSGALAGLHLEGPFIAESHCGAHNPALLRHPEPALVDSLIEAADSTLTMVTMAPELPGALEAIGRLTSAGIQVGLGHTAASEDVMRQAIDAGARVITHLYNGMPPLHHRAPGPVGVALTDARLSVELIVDGVHAADTAVDLARHAAAGRLNLISDAMSATGLGDGTYQLAGSQVTVADGAARLTQGGSLAGSTATVAQAAQRLLTAGISLAELVDLSSAAARRALGHPAAHLREDESADLVELTGSEVTAVMRRGQWLASSA